MASTASITIDGQSYISRKYIGGGLGLERGERVGTELAKKTRLQSKLLLGGLSGVNECHRLRVGQLSL